MRLAEPIIRALDFFYVRPVAVLLPRQTFRYAACGLMTLGLDAVWYALFYNFVFDRVDFSLGPIVLSPHIAALFLVFPITFSRDSGSTAMSRSGLRRSRPVRSSGDTDFRSWVRFC